ncbi:MAG: xanthine dehydrogenase family protein molybdopterin-binding subunit, partial [Acidimicrobiia bacterium]
MTDSYTVVGRPAPRVDSMSQTSGRTQYADDMSLPGMLAGKLLRSTHAHAAITRIDTAKAESLDGVRAVITGESLPIRYGILPVSQDETALAIDKVRYVGEPVVAVAAVDEDTAEQALGLIQVEYEPLPLVMTIEGALDPASPLLHEDSETGNVHRAVALEFGDVDEGLAAADHVRQDFFFFGGNNHAALEQHSAVALFGPDGRLTLWSSTQVPHYLHRILEQVLEVPAARIRVMATPSGGGFGAKSDVFSHEIVAAKLSERTGRPVKITLTREEVFYAHRGRHPVQMRVKTGFAADGEITAMHFQTFVDGGAYGSYGVA